jgi:hypothetical protein
MANVLKRPSPLCTHAGIAVRAVRFTLEVRQCRFLRVHPTLMSIQLANHIRFLRVHPTLMSIQLANHMRATA